MFQRKQELPLLTVRAQPLPMLLCRYRWYPRRIEVRLRAALSLAGAGGTGLGVSPNGISFTASRARTMRTAMGRRGGALGGQGALKAGETRKTRPRYSGLCLVPSDIGAGSDWRGSPSVVAGQLPKQGVHASNKPTKPRKDPE